jgi:hypothetical protein
MLNFYIVLLNIVSGDIVYGTEILMLAHLILDTVEGAIISKRSMLVANATGRKK